MKVMTVFGTRPEAIKMAPVVQSLLAHPEIETKVCLTAQHREMLDQVVDLFKLPVDYDLDIMRSGQSLYDITSRVLRGLEEVLEKEKPDYVLVHGDTTTTFTASLAAFYKQIKVGHVEAGLRTGDLAAPFPEEANRQLTGVLASLHFAPTETARENLLRENKKDENITIAITKKGGHIVYFNCNRDVNEEKLSYDDANKKGLEFLNNLGINNMKETYYLNENGIITINYAYNQDDVIMYPDLIKVKVALDDGEILGVETKGYLNNHTERKISKNVISIDEAKKKLNKNLNIQSEGMAIIPTGI